MNTTDERDDRANLPSASSWDRLVRCPGSWQAEQGLPELPTQQVTQDGDDIHAAVETGDDSDLGLTQKEIVAKLREMEEREVANFADHYNLAGPAKVIREERFWIRDWITLERVASARPDVIHLFPGGYTFVGNFKTGFADLTPSELNWQCRLEVLAVWHGILDHATTVKVIRGALLSSRLSTTFDSTDYNLDDLITLENAIRTTLWRAKHLHSERVPGRHCRYCKAQGVCREAATYSLVVASQVPQLDKPELAAVEAVSRMTPAELAFVFKRKTTIEAIFKSVTERLKSLPKDDLAAVGYQLAPGVNGIEVTDFAGAFQALGNLLSPEERVQCAKLLLGRAEELIAAKNATSKKAAKEQLRTTLAEWTIPKIGNPRLKPV